MSFTESIRTCLRKYATFSGRARRSEYWWFHLFYALCFMVMAILAIAINSSVPMILILALILPSMAVQVRRLHDSGRSGWWLLIAIIPYLGAIILIICSCQSSVPVTTKYGPEPERLGPSPATYTNW